MKKTTLALFFGNRGFMPEEYITEARKEMVEAVENAGFDYIMMDTEATRFGGVETRDEGRIYAEWLKQHKGEYAGVVLSMPIFIDENGAITALEKAGVPILMQAYPDEINKMDFEHRRDAYCGKFSVTDVFEQYRVPYTLIGSHVVHPNSAEFMNTLKEFGAVCRVANGMKNFNVGCFGARTTAFKTVRYDELAVQRYGINIESFDLSHIFHEVQEMTDDDQRVLAKKERLNNYSDFTNVPEYNFNNLAKLGVIIDEYIEEYHLGAVTIRCWIEMQKVLNISPCVLLGELNDRGIPASCEMDLCSAITMRAMYLASEEATTCLDWNNNYGNQKDKVVLFHCGPVPTSLMTSQGTITDHKMIAKTDPGISWGTNEGRMRSFPMTFSNCKTEDGKLYAYVSEGNITDDTLQEGFFGCGGVAEISGLEEKMMKLAKNGFKHHTTIGVGSMKTILTEAFENYLGYEVVDIDA